MKTDIISRMEEMQQRFGRLQLCDRETHVQKFDREIGLDQSAAASWTKRWEAELKDRDADWVQDGDPPELAGESELDYNERTGRYDQ